MPEIEIDPDYLLPEFRERKPVRCPKAVVDEVRRRTGRTSSLIRQVVYGNVKSSRVARVIAQVREELNMPDPAPAESDTELVSTTE